MPDPPPALPGEQELPGPRDPGDRGQRRDPVHDGLRIRVPFGRALPLVRGTSYQLRLRAIHRGYETIAVRQLTEGEELELTVDSLAFGGAGVARLDGYVVFVRDAVPGDRVRAVVSKSKRAYGEARAIEIIRERGDDTPHDDIAAMCRFLESTVDEFFATAERFRNPAIWERRGGRWVIPEFLIEDWAW